MTPAPARIEGTPTCSVVVPAHDEGPVIDRLLAGLLASAAPGEFAVHVVANGCSDDTAVRAAGWPEVTVHETPTASKNAALNIGDRAAGEVFPRLYLDADIVVSTESVRSVVAQLGGPEALAAAPGIVVDTVGRPALVKAFYTIFLQLPWMTDNLVGSGFYGVSAAGRKRFGAFPDVTNDDLYFRLLFPAADRRTVPGATFSVQAPRSTRALVRAKARVASGNADLLPLLAERDRSAHGRRPRGGSLPFLRLLRRPGNWVPLAGYATVRAASRVLSMWRAWRGTDRMWSQDRSTRGAAPVEGS